VEVRVSKALYLLNQTPAVPATPENLGRLMLDDVNASVDEAVADVQSALNTLVDKRKVLTETNDQGDEVYTLVSEEQESIPTRAQTKAEQISPHQLSAWLETRAPRERRLLPERQQSARGRRGRRAARSAPL